MSQPTRAFAPAPTESIAAPTVAPVAPRGLAALAGIVSALVALAAGELFAGLLAGVPSPIAAVGSAVIDFAPPGSKDFMVSLFGTNDKTALTVAVVAAVVARRRAPRACSRGARSGVAGAASSSRSTGVGALAALRARRQRRRCRCSCRRACGRASRSSSSTPDELGASGRPATPRLGRPRPRAAGVAGSSGPRRARRRSRLSAVASARACSKARAENATEAGAEIPARRRPRPRAAPPTPRFAIDGLTPLVVPNDDSTGSTRRCSSRPSTSTAGRCGSTAWSTRRSPHLRPSSSSCR